MDQGLKKDLQILEGLQPASYQFRLTEKTMCPIGISDFEKYNILYDNWIIDENMV